MAQMVFKKYIYNLYIKNKRPKIKTKKSSNLFQRLSSKTLLFPILVNSLRE